MLGFPPPYSEELLYSTIARAGVHDGETSPKQLLDRVFYNRSVIATVDLPSHVGKLASQYNKSLGLDLQTLVSRHTLWPIYAPFLPRERNIRLRSWMGGISQGAAHLASGIVASRVNSKSRLYVCAKCLKEQRIKFGECFLSRIWQAPVVKICPQHGPLSLTTILIDGEHRHTYTAIDETSVLGSLNTSYNDELFSRQVSQLILVESEGISHAQWTAFYKHFTSSQGYLNGLRVYHASIHNKVINFWGKAWLEDASILPSCTETSWLKALFRKHRKSFSFAEHIVVITALSNGKLNICDAIDKASSMEISIKEHTQETRLELIAANKLNQDQIKWKQLLEHNPPKASRKKNPALYARLYRNHYNWLMYINSLFLAKKIVVNKRVDWQQRDSKTAQELRRVFEELTENLNAPHLSKTFLIHQLEKRATVEKNVQRLPRCSRLLSIYAETTAEYQARRLARALIAMLQRRQKIKRWSLLRQAGLSDERMTDIIAKLLKEILSEHT
ncbi:TnsD family Tn7-like transposition protein [Paraglaciecola chathamensis]|nr:TnsD family Tn7-like transposition protein [Paraglaciecola oceanifecundans]